MNLLHLISTSAFILHALCITSVSGLYDGSSDVEIFENKSDFRKKVLDGDGVSLIQFYAPWCGHCKQFAPVYNQIASILKGVVTVGVVDASSDGPQKRIAADYGVQGFPTMKLLVDAGDGSGKKKATDVQSREPGEIINASMQAIQDLLQSRAANANGSGGGGGTSSNGSSSNGNSSNKSKSSSSSGGSRSKKNSKVMQLTSSNFDEMVYKNTDVVCVAFIAPWCGHCKALLPEWEEAAKKIHGSGAVLGLVDATVHEDLAQQFGVQGFPTIKIFPGGEKKGVIGARSAMEYQGGRQSEQIVQYVLAEVDRSGVPKEIPELVSSDIMDDLCRGGGHQNTICVFAALPHILDTGAEGRNKYKDIVTAASKAVRGMSFQFVWFEGSSQPDLENALEMTFGFPAIAAYSMEKGVYTVHRGSFTETNIRKFLMGITTGKQATYKISKIPTVQTVEPWDGKDGAPFEEEFSLEDIMGDDDEL